MGDVTVGMLEEGVRDTASACTKAIDLLKNHTPQVEFCIPVVILFFSLFVGHVAAIFAKLDANLRCPSVVKIQPFKDLLEPATKLNDLLPNITKFKLGGTKIPGKCVTKKIDSS